MKPREFDELIKQKFDQGDFEYNPGNWDKLADELDGRAKKRNVMIWWLLPLAGVAASVALAMGVPGLFRHIEPAATVAKTELVQERTYTSIASAQTEPAAAQTATVHNTPIQQPQIHNRHKQSVTADNKDADNRTELVFHDAADEGAHNSPILPGRTINLLAISNIPSKNKEQKKPVVINEGYNTFKPEVTAEVKKAPRLSIILSGGINKGNQNNGYTAGATIRRMLNDKVYFEGDVAFSNSSNTQATQYLASEGAPSGSYAKTGAAKTSSPDASKTVTSSPPVGIIKEMDINYNLSYAQVTPSIGYKLMKRMSIAAGPDFQQMLADNRPATSTVDRGNIQQAAMFDVGFIGKTEYSITRNVKAAVSYRKGINSVITPTDKYIDRDYLQFQIRCAVFNK